MRDRLQIRIDPEMLSDFKTLCYFSGVTMTEIIQRYVEMWVDDSATMIKGQYGLSQEALDRILRRDINVKYDV